MTPEDPTSGPHLSAILHADMVDYSSVTARSERLSERCVAAIRDAFAEAVPKHEGWFHGKAGDAILGLFPSAVGAVEAAIEVQRRLERVRVESPDLPAWIRIGAHMGEVTPSGDDWQGDSINTAARIQAEADPGGLKISGEVYRAVRNKMDVVVEDLGLVDLKGVGSCHLFKLVIGTERPVGRSPLAAFRVSRREVAGGALLMVVAAVYLFRNRLLPLVSGAPTRTPPPAEEPAWPLAIGIMEISPIGDTPPWMCDLTHQGLNALLAKLEKLSVFSKDVIDWKKEKTGKKSFDVAKDLGLRKMLNGTLVRQNGHVTLQVRVVDATTGRQEDACDASGTEDQIFAIEHDVALQLVKVLKVPISETEAVRIAAKPKTVDLDAAKRFADAFGAENEEPAPTPRPGARWIEWPPSAYAAGNDEAEVKALLERYRTALEAKDLEQIVAIYVALSDNTRNALERYFAGANDLNVQFSNVTVLFEGDEALATFTRRDKFKDKDTGRDVNLEVRVSTVIAKADGAWKIKAWRKPS